MSRMFSRSSQSSSSPLDILMSKKEAEVRALFNVLDVDGVGYVTTAPLRAVAEAAGMDPDRVALASEIEKVADADGNISFKAFFEMATGEPTLLQKTVTGTLAIPSFREFCEDLVQLFEEVRPDNQGHNATYIPELATVDPNKFAFAACTVDGQVFSYGDLDDFCMQSCAKPFVYALACEELGVREVHKFVGREPSGVAFNAFSLNRDNKPHNPMINSGAIMTHSLVHRTERASKRIHYVLEMFKRIAGNGKIGFSQPTYLSERETADRNFALAYFMKSQGAFPDSMDVTSDLEFYFQVCSTEVNVRTLAVMAATLANGGTCPLTDVTVYQHDTVKSCLQLMLSCGMYDYSGEWACTIGLPAKSGVSGSIFVVIPNVMGLAIWSPRLDERGNSYRGIQFCEKLCDRFSLSIFDQILQGVTNKIDPTTPLHSVTDGAGSAAGGASAAAASAAGGSSSGTSTPHTPAARKQIGGSRLGAGVLAGDSDDDNGSSATRTPQAAPVSALKAAAASNGTATGSGKKKADGARKTTFAALPSADS